MRIQLITGAAIAVVVSLTGCTSEPTETSARGVDAQPETPYELGTDAPQNFEPPPPPPEHPAMSKVFIYEDGLSVMVSPKGEFEPSEYAAYSEAPYYLRFEIWISNGTGEEFDPSMALVYVQSGGVESEEIFDSENGLVGAPSGILLHGRSVTYDVAFGVSDPTDLVVQLEPSFDHKAAIFVS